MQELASADELQVELLGPLAVSRRSAGPISMGSRPQRRLLAVLALHVGDEVRSESLEDWLVLSPGALRTSVSRLRRVIGADALETTALGYRLCAEVDAVAFEQLVHLATEVDDAAARAALEEALGFWQGDPFVEFAGEPWAEPAVWRLRELHASAVEDLAVLQLDAGEASSALVAIQSLVDRESFRERSQALVMRALVEGGRPTEALRAFHAYRSLVHDEIGIEPTAALVELDRAIAASIGSRTSLGPRPGDPAWTRARRSGAAPGHRHGPPVPVSSFVGRREDLTTVLELVRHHRLVTLTGSGGCGKTRLAIAAAAAVAAEGDRHGPSVRWVELGVVPVGADVVEPVAAAVGLAPQPRGDPTVHLLEHAVGATPMLLVVDNAEHVLDAVTALLAELLPRCPSLRVLVTSREPLGIAGEVVWRVPSLAVPPPEVSVGVDDLASFDALQLFVVRARDARPGFVVNDEVLRHVAVICVGVDGVPLAVELAAARTRNLPIEVVAAGITDAVRWQATGSRAPLGRHATLHASIAWSLELIDPLARSVLVRLAVFQASFTLEAALAVGGDGEPSDAVADAVGALVDASLLQLDDVTGRFRMLQTVRRFCSVRSPDEVGRARSRHAHHLAAFCVEVGAGRRGIERLQFIREMPDLVAALEWAGAHEPRLAFAMCAGLAPVRSAIGHHGNVADTWRWLLSLDRDAHSTSWCEEWATAVAAQMAAATAHRIDVSTVAGEVDRLLPADADRARGWLVRGGAMMSAYEGRLGPILGHVEAVRGRRDDLEDSIYGGFAAYMLALMGRVDESDRHGRELVRLTRRHHTTFRVDTVGNGYAAAVLVDLFRGDLRSAVRRADQEVPHDPAFSMTAAAALAHVALVARDRRVLARAVEWSQQRTIPMLRFLPTFIDLVQRRFDGELDHAADLAEQFWEEAATVPLSRVHPLPLLTAALMEAGRRAEARAMTSEAADLVAGMDRAPLLSAGLAASRALIAAGEGAAAEVASCLAAALETATAHGFVPMTVDVMGQVAAMAGDPEMAATLRLAVDEEQRRLGVRLRRSTDGGAPSGTSVPFAEAIVLARRWLADAVPRTRADAQL
jgi:predicted ATPase/DNA-binding SARP family transcriptional activator